ncbi:serine/threonine protein kinase [Mastigocladus laminosus UU774]|nr:serine/threonine protein kinase [Westiellopsis prolifica IICB1]TFI51501.1 serine/threonine protein kinase [Mastigocladus laminosus UU774]
MAYHMIGKVLQGQYQIVQSLGAGVFGQTYVAIDVEQPHQPKCVIKQLKVSSSQPAYLQSLRLHFLTETETLRYLGHHDQIPQLIACFEENERFYLVQEFIEGHALTAELPINQRSDYLWTEYEIIQFLKDVLEILKFVHSQGVIHCDVKPENLVRRDSDGKLVLIDFGSIQPINFGVDGVDTILPICRVPVTSLGYIPPEQFIDQTQPNSDIYALGMIAIQALTGLSPLQLKTDPRSNEFLWRSHHTPISDYLAAILSQMIRYDYKDRFQSVAEILRALEQMSMEYYPAQTIDLQNATSVNSSEPVPNVIQEDVSVKSPPLLTGMRVGLLANSLVMGFGVYSLMNSPAYSETETLYKATEEFQDGDLEEAIALAKSIPLNSNVYPEAQSTIEDWQNQWQLATEQYLLAKQALEQEQWSEVVNAASQIPDILYWKLKTDPIVEQAKAKIETQTNNLLARAYEKAAVKDFNTAVEYLQQIPQENSVHNLVQQKLAEYQQKQHIRAVFLLQQAYNKAEIGEFNSAVNFLQQVPKNSSVYATAQTKLEEYVQKQRLQGKNQKVAPPKVVAALSKETSTGKSFEPGSLMQEVNITPNTTSL